MGLASRARQSWSKKRKHPNFVSPPQANASPQSKYFLFNRTKKTVRIRRGFEHLSSCSGWRVITKKPWATIVALVVVKGLSVSCQSESVNTLASGRFWGFPRKKHQNACGFAWEFLWSGMLDRPGKSLKRRGKYSSLHSKKNFLLGVRGFFVSNVISGGLLGHLGPLCLALGANR